jgi:hypothetical protein
MHKADNNHARLSYVAWSHKMHKADNNHGTLQATSWLWA